MADEVETPDVETTDGATGDEGTIDSGDATVTTEDDTGSDTTAGDDKAGDDSASDDEKSYWPEDWREKYAGDDEKLLKRLGRYASPEAVLDSLISAQNKISAGELKQPLSKDATPEELAAWREENGIPAKAEDYKIELPDGLVVGDADKPYVDSFLETALENNMDPEAVNNTLSWYFDLQDKGLAVQAENDQKFKLESTDILREEWGPEYRANINMINNMLSSWPTGVGEEMMMARMPDGSLLGSHPDVLRSLIGQAREMNPAGTLAPGSGAKAASAINDRIAELESKMDDRDKWFKDKSSQQELTKLYEARDKVASR